MSPSNLIIVLMSLGSAGVFLALVIGMRDEDAESIVTSFANMTPAARRKARFEQLDEMTRTADESIAARQMGKRAPFQHNQY
jgi:hypothetical protein